MNAKQSNFKMSELSINEFFQLKENSKIRFDCAFQRGERSAWHTASHVDAYVDSILRGYPMPAIFVFVDSAGVYWVMDGQQRITTALGIMSDTYKTLPVNESALPENYLSAMSNPFSAWVGGIQGEFKDYAFQVIDCSCMSDDEESLLFSRLNGGGVKLSYLEVMKGRYSQTWKSLQPVLDSTFWASHSITAQVRDSVLIQLVNSLVAGLSVNHISKSLAEWFISWQYDSTIANKILNALNLLDSIAGVDLESDSDTTVRKSWFKKINLESILFGLASGSGFDAIDCSLYLIEFFRQRGEYRGGDRIIFNESSSSNTASTEQIIKRHNVMINVLSGKFERCTKPEKVVEPKPAKIEKTKDSRSKKVKSDKFAEKNLNIAIAIDAKRKAQAVVNPSITLDADIAEEVEETRNALSFH
jgi:hypothetical protein